MLRQLLPALALGLSTAAFAAAPATLPITGFLSDDAGVPLDGDLPVTFKLYEADAEVWSDTLTVSVDQGQFTAYLGSGAPLDLELFAVSEPHALGIAVDGGAEMSPRVALGSAPFAAYAQYCDAAESVGGYYAEDFRMAAEDVDWADIANAPTYAAGVGLALDGTTFSADRGVVEGWARGVAYDSVNELRADLDPVYMPDVSCLADQLLFADGVGGWVCGDASDIVDEAAVDAWVGNNGYALGSDITGLDGRLDAAETTLTALDTRLDTVETGALAQLPASPNLLVDTRMFYGFPQTGTSTVTATTAFGPWTYHKYDDASANFTVEDPPSDLGALVQGTWWPHGYKVLHVKFNPGGASPGRLLQQALPSDKNGPIATSAYVKVLTGGLYVGQEFGWTLVTNNTWQRVSDIEGAPNKTLGGAWGFAGKESVVSEALIALPKVEASPVATRYIETPWSPTFADSVSYNPSAGFTSSSSSFTTITGSSKTVSVPVAGPMLVNWSIGAFANGTSGYWVIRPVVGGVAGPETVCFTNEANSHKNCSGTVLLNAAAGSQTAQLQVRVDAGNFYQNLHDHVQWTAMLVK